MIESSVSTTTRAKVSPLQGRVGTLMSQLHRAMTSLLAVQKINKQDAWIADLPDLVRIQPLLCSLSTQQQHQHLYQRQTNIKAILGGVQCGTGDSSSNTSNNSGNANSRTPDKSGDSNDNHGANSGPNNNGGASSGSGAGGDDRDNKRNNRGSSKRSSVIVSEDEKDKENSENNQTDNEDDSIATPEGTPPGSLSRSKKSNKKKRAPSDSSALSKVSMSEVDHVNQVKNDVDNILTALSDQGCGDMELIEDFDIIEQRMGGDAPKLNDINMNRRVSEPGGSRATQTGLPPKAKSTSSRRKPATTSGGASRTRADSDKDAHFGGSGVGSVGVMGAGSAFVVAPKSRTGVMSAAAKSAPSSQASRGSRWRVWRRFRAKASPEAVYGVTSGKRRVLECCVGTKVLRIGVGRRTTHDEVWQALTNAASTETIILPKDGELVVERENSKILFANMFGGALPYECDKLLCSEGQTFRYVLLSRVRTRTRRRVVNAQPRIVSADDDSDDDIGSYDEGDGHDVFLLDAELISEEAQDEEGRSGGSGLHLRRRRSGASASRLRKSLGRSNSELSVLSIGTGDSDRSEPLTNSDDRPS